MAAEQASSRQAGQDRSGTFWLRRRGWIAAHFLCGIAAAVLGFGALLGMSLAIFALPAASPTRLATGLTMMAAPVALAPLIAYQSWALRGAVAPWTWIAAWIAAVLPAPWIVALVLRASVLRWGNDTVFAAWIGGAVMAAAWAASMQWLALRRKVSFGRWMAWGGLGLALGMLAVGVGFVASLLVFPLLWSLAVPLAFALYGALTWRALGCLLRPER